jgi:hypothetical protein
MKRALPTRLDDAGEVSLERLLSETNAAEAKTAHIATWATAHGAAVVHTNSEFAASLSDNH